MATLVPVVPPLELEEEEADGRASDNVKAEDGAGCADLLDGRRRTLVVPASFDDETVGAGTVAVGGLLDRR